MRLLLAIMVGLLAMLALNGAVGAGAAYAASSSNAHDSVAVESHSPFNYATADCCDNNGPCSHERREGGACVCPACGGAGAAVHFAPDFVLGLPIAGAYSVPIPTELLHHGVIVRPITGPPRLSA
jgi:hypothetical protein